MAHTIAFLRAINVTKRFVTMVRLKAIFVEMGLEDVETWIQSGNVIFKTPKNTHKLAERIEQALAKELGFEVPTCLRKAQEVRDITACWPFPGEGLADNEELYVTFLRNLPGEAQRQRLLALSNTTETLHLEGQHLYMIWRRALGKSKIGNARVERLLKVSATRRNISSLRKLVAKYLT